MKSSPVCVAAATLLLLAGCGDSGEPSAGGAPATAPRPVVASNPAPPTLDPALGAYLDALEALREGRSADAPAHLDTALQSAPDDHRLLLARAVARLLGADFVPAKSDLLRLDRQNGHAQLWLYAHSVMTGDMAGLPTVPDNMRASYEETACVNPGMSVPGYVVQGKPGMPTDYASFVLYDMARTYGRQRCAGAIDDPMTRPLLTRAGRWFAYLAMAAPDLIPYHLARSRTWLAAGDPDKALTYATFALAGNPGDAAATQAVAMANLEAERFVTARRTFTMALTQNNRAVESYLGRALAAAHLGDLDRMDRDLRVAAELDDDLADTWEDAIVEAAEGSNPELHTGATLETLARYERADNELLDAAVALHQSQAGERMRFDEIYQERVRTLEWDADANPDDPGGWTRLAIYVGNEARLRGESVEPRRSLVPYRWQASRDAELNRALAFAQRAVAAGPRDVRAAMAHADVLAALGRDEQAEREATRALELDPDDPEALTLFALYQGRRAIALENRATALRQSTCTSSTREENRSDGVWEIRTTTCTPPTAADLAQARQLDVLAAQMRERSQAVMRRAMELTRGTYQGYLLQADVYLWQHDNAGAVAALRKAAALDPADPRAHETLATLLARLGEPEAAAEEQILVNAPLQTTAAPMLALARSAIELQRWDTAARYLDRAATLDPLDARVPAYLGVVLESLGRPAEARAAYRRAIAFDRAAIRLDGGDVLPRSIDDRALEIALTHRLARAAAGSGDVAAAMRAYEEITALPARFAPGWQAQEMFLSNLPPDQDPPVNGATLIALAHLELGRLQKAGGLRDAAIRSFEAAIALGPDTDRPNIGAADGSSNFAGDAGFPAGDSVVELATLYAEAGDAETANEVMQKIGFMKTTDASRAQAVTLSRQMAKLAGRAQQQNERQVVQQDAAYTRNQQALRADLQRQRENPAGRRPSGLAASLRVHPAVVGHWRLIPQADWALVGGGGAYDFGPDGQYRFAPDDGSPPVDGSWGSVGAGFEAILLLGSDGSADTIYLERSGPDGFVVTMSDAVKYDLRRAP